MDRSATENKQTKLATMRFISVTIVATETHQCILCVFLSYVSLPAIMYKQKVCYKNIIMENVCCTQYCILCVCFELRFTARYSA